jgi:hypothetical protein
VDEFDGDELVCGEFHHGQVPQIDLRNLAHDYVAERRVKRERAVQMGDAQA